MGDFFFNLGRSVSASARKGKWLWQSLTGSEEDRIAAEFESGADLARQFAAEAPILREPMLAQVIDHVGGQLAARVKNKQRKFTFAVVQMPEPNAFALPGGFIFITTGLLELCGMLRATAGSLTGQGEIPAASGGDAPATGAGGSQITIAVTATTQACEELAFVLGHEMAHVIRGHAFDRMVNSTVVNTAAKAIPIGGMLGRMVVQAGLKFAHSAYSHEHEFEADELGVRLAAAAGYDPTAATRMLERLGRLDAAAGGLGDYFRSHPPFKQRIDAIRKLT